LAKRCKHPTVIALIAKKSGFVRLGKIDFVGDAVLADFQWANALVLRVIADGQRFDSSDFGIDLDPHSARAESFVQCRHPIIKALPHGEGGNFDREDICEFIDDETGELIGIAVHRAVGFGGFVEAENVATEFPGALDGIEKKRFIWREGSVGCDAERDFRTGIPKTNAETLTFFIEHLDEVACFAIG